MNADKRASREKNIGVHSRPFAVGSWRDHILREFTPQIARLTLVADPDGLLLEEGILEGIRERGFELVPFEDHVAFRYVYESQFRSRWDRGETTDLVVVLRSASSDLDTLPYDLLQAGRKLSFNLGDLFPNLSYPVAAALDRADFDVLFDAQAKYLSKPLGDNASKDFILRHVFEIVPELIKQPADLLRVLLRRHYGGQHIPAILDGRFIQLLRRNDVFEDWPLEIVIPDREAFFAFLQERWPVFLDSIARPKSDAVREGAPEYSFEFPGPTLLPFDHDDIRIYMDNLFIEGLLQPVPHEQSKALAKSWVAYGINVSLRGNIHRRMEGLLDVTEKTLPTEKARYGEWLQFSYRWAGLSALKLELGTNLPEERREQLEALRSRIDSAFTGWVLERYASLINLPPAPPVMLHHIPRFLARILGDKRQAKIAFLLVDGLALNQWIALRGVLGKMDSRLQFREDAVFAWIPTITSVSRQAAFAGKPPIYFPGSIHTTSKERNHWSQFWADQGLKMTEVNYLNVNGDPGEIETITEQLGNPKLRVFGLVIRKVDKIMHGMELGAAGMHNQVRQWATQGFMQDILGLLHDRGFQVFLASDHGNIEAKGIGRPAEGVVADTRGQRVRVYPDRLLRDQIKKRFPEAVEWPPVGLPEDYLALIAPGRAAFARRGEQIVCHGGMNIDELIVPFIRIDRRQQ